MRAAPARHRHILWRLAGPLRRTSAVSRKTVRFAARGSARKAGSYPANPWGIHDMHGNVWEWCRDYYHTHCPAGPIRIFVKSRLGQPDGTYSRVRRGGAWIEGSGPDVQRAVCATNRLAGRSHRVPGYRGRALTGVPDFSCDLLHRRRTGVHDGSGLTRTGPIVTGGSRASAGDRIALDDEGAGVAVCAAMSRAGARSKRVAHAVRSAFAAVCGRTAGRGPRHLPRRRTQRLGASTSWSQPSGIRWPTTARLGIDLERRRHGRRPRQPEGRAVDG